MPGDYSRNTFIRQKQYRGVLKQQGRVDVDADWNEQVAIQLYRTETEAVDVIGPCGVPKGSAGFKIETTPDGLDLKISNGRIYVNGILCECESELPTTYSHQPFYPNPEYLAPLSPLASPLDGIAALNLADGIYLVFLDVWQREVTALEDPFIREKALGGPDTAARLQNIWQVKLLQVTPVSTSPPLSPPETAPMCDAAFPEFEDYTAPSTGKLNAQTATPTDDDDPCQLPPTAGYRRLENQLYRVEVHTGGNRNSATFKWSRDNGIVTTLIEKIESNTLTVSDLGKDEMLGFAADQWVEIIDDESEFKNNPRPLAQIQSIDPSKRQIVLKSTAPVLGDKSGQRLRRWDQASGAGANGVQMTANWIDLEGGIQIRFSTGSYRSGDYWLVPARTATGEIEWPPFEIPNINPVPQPPLGIHHHYCRLALLHVSGGAISHIDDCRDLFPPLTDLTADDVSFNNSACQLPCVTTVQQALDALCHGHGGCCALVVKPGDNLQTLFNQIADGGDAHVCFQAGTYTLPGPITVANKGNVKISGSGEATRLIAARSETAVVFQNCKRLQVEDLHAETGVTGSNDNLNGTLSFFSCEAVSLQRISVRCASGAVRIASCITVRDERATAIQGLSRCSVRIHHCDVAIGHQQVGILLVDVGRATVEDNLLRVAPRPPGVTLAALARDKSLRARVRRLMVANARVGAAPPGAPATNVSVSAGGRTFSFLTDPALVSAWQPALTANPPPPGTAGSALLDHLYSLADRLILNAGTLAGVAAFAPWFAGVAAQSDPSVASQGIVIGGRAAQDIQISGNTIEGVIQGVHVGVSHREGARGIPDQAVTVAINDNRVRLFLSPLARRERHGIFVGNCDTLYVENNHVIVQRFGNTSQVPIDGVRVHGHLGLLLMIRENHLVNFTVGVRVTPLFCTPPNRTIFQWLVAHNMMPNSTQTVVAPLTVRRIENFA